MDEYKPDLITEILEKLTPDSIRSLPVNVLSMDSLCLVHSC